MLVLSRKKGERVVIGPNIYVTVVDVRGDAVKLGFEAPTTVPIHREEVFQYIQREATEQSWDDSSRSAEFA